MTTEQSPLTQDGLDQKLTQAFDGKVVRKDLVRKVKVGANVPSYVLEYLLGKYCATDDPVAVEAGLVLAWGAAWAVAGLPRARVCSNRNMVVA